MLDYQTVRNWDFGEVVQRYTERDTMLYALAVGLAADPLDAAQLRYVTETDLRALPSMAATLGVPYGWLNDPRSGVDHTLLVHGEQSVIIYQPLPPAATIVARNRVVAVTDKGPGRGAVVLVERELREQGSIALLARATSLVFLRGDGGFSAGGGASDPAPPSLPPVPERPADLQVGLATLPQQALLYRLSGDYNPLHSDPGVALAAGFARPILHGLCSFGIAAHAVLRRLCDYDAARLRTLAMRFKAPVYPGETLRFELWQRDAATFHLRAQVDARAAVVLDNGLVELG